MEENINILKQRKLAEDFGLYVNYLDNPKDSLKDKFVILKDEKIEFEYVDIIPEVSILIPTDFFVMERKIKRVKFLGNLENNVYTDENYDVNIYMFDNLVNLDNDNIKEFIEKFKEEYHKLKNESIAWDTKSIEVDGFVIYYFEQIISSGISNTYSILFFVQTPKGYYHGFISFSEKEMFNWRYIGIALLENIKIKGGFENAK